MAPEDFAIVRFMEFGVLGPLRVVDQNTTLPLGGPKQRTLLALLIAGAGTPVSTDSLIMGVYGPDGSPKDRRTLQTYISTFRRSLGDVIDRDGDAYKLGIDLDSIDAIRFERLIVRARMAVSDSRSAEALHEALGLWRGDPYCDVELSGELQVEIRRLEELRAEALEARIDLDLAIGRHHELIAELETLVADYPFREGLRSRQMVALYRCGRQADALRAYRDIEERVRDEVGLDTSKELKQLELQILEQDDVLDYSPKPRARSEPSRYTSFVGRRAEITSVIDLLRTHRLVTITGTGGIGKSSLGAEVARTLADSTTTVYVPIESHRAANPLLLIAQSLGLAPADDADLLAIVSHALKNQTSMILLDGCEHIIDQLPRIVDQILGRCPTSRILITSRERLSVPGEAVFELGPLEVGDDSASSQLLADRAGFILGEIDDDTVAAVSEIGSRLSGMPLALELAAAQWASMTPKALVAQLDDQMALLTVKRNADRRHTSIAAALDWSHSLFTPGEQDAFQRLSVFRGEISTDGAELVLDTDTPTEILRDLFDRSALVSLPGGGYQMLEPVRQYAWKRLDESGNLDATRLRYTEWIIQRCRWIADELNVARSPASLAILRSEGAEIAAIAAWSLEHNRPDIVLSIIAALGRVWWQALDPTLIQQTALGALNHPDASTGDLAIQALAHTAFLHRTTDREATRQLVARLESVSKEVTDPATRVIVLQMRALLPQSRSAIYGTDEHDAIIAKRLELLDESLQIAGDLGIPKEPELYNRAILLEALRRFDEADKDLQSLLAWAGTSNSVDRGAALVRLAMSNLRRSRFSEGVDMAREATRLLLDTGHLGMAGDAAWVRSYGHFYMHEYRRGVRWVDRGDEYYRFVGMPPAREWNPVHVAMFAAALENWEEVAETVGAFIDRAPDPSDPVARRSFLLGHPSVGSPFIRALYPAARWLVAQGRFLEAAQIVTAAPRAREQSGLSEWDMEAVLSLRDGLSEYPAEDHPETLEDLFQFISGCFRPDLSVVS